MVYRINDEIIYFWSAIWDNMIGIPSSIPKWAPVGPNWGLIGAQLCPTGAQLGPIRNAARDAMWRSLIYM